MYIVYGFNEKCGLIIFCNTILDDNVKEYINDNALTVNISRLRSKLEDFGYPNAIETRKGQGYILL